MTLLMHRHVCRVEWPPCLAWCLSQFGVEVFATMFGPYFLQCSGTLRSHDRTEALSYVRVPTLLMRGEHDCIAPECASSARDRIEHSELFFARHCSHMPCLESSQPYREHLLRFLPSH